MARSIYGLRRREDRWRGATLAVVLSLVFRARRAGADEAGRVTTPLLPLFVAGFLMLAVLNSAGFLAPQVKAADILVSRWALLAAIAAVGLKSSLKWMTMLGPVAVALVIGETLFLAGFVFLGLTLIG